VSAQQPEPADRLDHTLHRFSLFLVFLGKVDFLDRCTSCLKDSLQYTPHYIIVICYENKIYCYVKRDNKIFSFVIPDVTSRYIST